MGEDLFVRARIEVEEAIHIRPERGEDLDQLVQLHRRCFLDQALADHVIAERVATIVRNEWTQRAGKASLIESEAVDGLHQRACPAVFRLAPAAAARSVATLPLIRCALTAS